MPNNKNDNGSGLFAGAAIATPFGAAMSYSISKMKDRGYLKMPKSPTASSFVSKTRNVALNSNAGAGSYYAPVNLPTGSVIKKVILICKDNNGSDDIDLTLYRLNQSGDYIGIATVSSSGTGAAYRTFAHKLTSNKYVNTWKFSYYLYLCLPGTDSDGYYYSQAKIIYTPPAS